jgi:hypothetical protein
MYRTTARPHLAPPTNGDPQARRRGRMGAHFNRRGARSTRFIQEALAVPEDAVDPAIRWHLIHRASASHTAMIDRGGFDASGLPDLCSPSASRPERVSMRHCRLRGCRSLKLAILRRSSTLTRRRHRSSKGIARQCSESLRLLPRAARPCRAQSSVSDVDRLGIGRPAGALGMWPTTTAYRASPSSDACRS